MIHKRFFISVLAVAYAGFAGARNLPGHGVQCILLALLTFGLVIWPVNEYVLINMLPDWVHHVFTVRFQDGLHHWVGLIMVYFVVGYYGHDILLRVRHHP